MPHDVLEDDKEVMERQVVAVEHTAETQRLLDQLFHYQFRYVDQVTALDDNRVARWGKIISQFKNNQMVFKTRCCRGKRSLNGPDGGRHSIKQALEDDWQKQ